MRIGASYKGLSLGRSGRQADRFFVRRFPAFVWINAGTLKRDDDPCFALIDLDRGEVHQFVLDEDLTVTRRWVALDALT